MMNRHGLVAGATGTGKTRTLQGLAEQLSAAGVSRVRRRHEGRPVRARRRPARPTGPRRSADAELGVAYTPTGFPVEYLALGGIGAGVPVRATVSDFGPQLLAKVLDANETQEQSLGLVFRYADEKQLPLLDLADLRALLTFLASDEGKAELTGIGGVSSQTVGVLLRTLVVLEDGGGTELFGEPQFDVADLLRTAPDGRGIISCLELPGVQDKPKLFSTALMWLLAELFEQLPEVGDLDKPKLVFFFDEAHLLFDGAIEGVPRVGRADGAADPLEGRRRLLRHADAEGRPGRRARAARQPRPARAARVHARRREGAEGDRLDVPEVGRSTTSASLLTQLGIGEAAVTILSETGVPTPVVHTKLRAPSARMAPADDVDARREGVAALREVRHARRQPERSRDAGGAAQRRHADAGSAGGGAQEGGRCDDRGRRRARGLPQLEAGKAAPEGSGPRGLRAAQEEESSGSCIKPDERGTVP